MTPSARRALFRTPLRDIFRGRITGRLDRAAAVADLPDHVAEYILGIVRRTRLWRLEKADVAREIASHFHEGLEAGADSGKLISDFGDPKKAARLIRRAKKRNRPLAWRSMIMIRNTVGILIGAFVGLYAFFFARYHLGEPNIARNYTAELNAPILAIPEDDRAWPVYVEALRRIPGVPEELMRATDWPIFEPDNPAWDAAVEYHTETLDGITLLHAAAKKPELGYPLSNRVDPEFNRILTERNGRVYEPEPEIEPEENPIVIGVLLPHLQIFREFARLHAFDMRLARHNTDPERWITGFESMLAMAAHSREHPTLISDLVSVAIFHLGLVRLDNVIKHDPGFFSDDDLRRLAHTVAGFEGGRIIPNLEGEQAFFYDAIQRCFTDDGNGNGHLINVSLLHTFDSLNDGGIGGGADFVTPLSLPFVGDRKWNVETYERMMRHIETQIAGDPWNRTENPIETEIEAERTLLGKAKWAFVGAIAPAMDSVTFAMHRSDMQRHTTLTAIALELYRRDHNEYPDALDDLVPGYLPSVPRDLFTGDPIGYLIADDGPVLYSRGVDRDDDGGRPPANTKRPNNSGASQWLWPDELEAAFADPKHAKRIDGDWILYPPIEPEEDE